MVARLPTSQAAQIAGWRVAAKAIAPVMVRQGWTCRFCGKSGVAVFRLTAGSVVGWEATKNLHAAGAPECAAVHGDVGIYVKDLGRA